MGWNDIILQLAILVLAIIDLVLNCKYIYEVMQMYTMNIYLQTRIQKLTIPEYKLKNVPPQLNFKDDNLTTLKIILK